MSIAQHLVATTRHGARTLLEPRRAAWLFARLRHHFPNALSCVLMPDHVHLVVLDGGRDRFVRVLAAFTARFGVGFDVLPVQPGASAVITARMIAYGYFNPVRARLVDDPWAWRWSTLRDLAGAAYPIWTPASHVARVIRVAPTRVVASLSTIADHPTPPLRREAIVSASLEGLRAAVGAALRLSDDDVLRHFAARRLIVQAVHAIGMPDARGLAAKLGCSERTIYRDRSSRHPALDAVLLCLGEERLRG